HNGQVVPLKPIKMTSPDLDHSYGASIADYDGGKMDGFDKNWTSVGKPAGRLAYSYVERGITAPYWSMARQYTLADRMFATEHGPSWTAHLDLIGTTNLSPTTALVDFPSNSPWDCAAPAGTKSSTINRRDHYRGNGPYPCFTQLPTMADTLDAAGVSWRYYAPAIKGDIGGIWSPFGAIKYVRMGHDWRNVINPPSQILTDVANGDLANVTWVTPEWNYSDHAGGGANMGPSWVSAVVNAIGQSPFWSSTAIVVLWDDWGGFYDDAVPPQLDFKGLGLRVPCIIISPYAQPGYVSHTQYEFGSVLAFIEQTFGLPALGPASAGFSDARATSILDSFNFTQTPLTFTPIAAPYPPSTFLKMPESGKVPDDE
ncbi:MAG TPA: alkaline phosphatase family protein, partial [Candidatus Baltobacteraceae bacterium]|nr:alkaline phosphatase family protein [Candidatus Baltobacteraceae bacterium]